MGLKVLKWSNAGPWLLAMLFVFATRVQAADDTPSLYPEQGEVDRILSGAMPAGVLLLVMEHDEEALQWVLPRVIRYVGQLRAKWRELPVVLLSHGDEMFALRSEYDALYPGIHQMARELVENQGVLFNVCEAWASNEGVAWDEFPDFIDVVPFAPAEIENYRNLDFKVINIEQTW